MSLDRLPLPAFLGGLAVLAGALLLLHLLRVRLRRVPVDSLLFFARLGTVQKPRVLPGTPARWLAYALALLALAGLWSAFAGLSQPAGGPSRVVLLDASGTAASSDGKVWDARRRAAQAMLANGLGPDGAVSAFAGELQGSLPAELPAGLLDTRAASSSTAGGSPTGPGTGVFAALRAARARLHGGEGDEIVILGGPPHLPASWDGVPVRRHVEPDTPPALGVVDSEQRGAGLEILVAAPGPCTVTLVSPPDRTLGERKVTPSADGTVSVTFTDLPDRGGVIELHLVHDGRTAVSRAMWSPPQPVRVHLDEVPSAVALAVAADAGFVESSAGEAQVVVTTRPDLDSELPVLTLAHETAPAPRAPALAEDCPLPLSLRDRKRTAPALVPRPGEEVWVFDALQGAPLLSALGDPVRRVRAATWLLEPQSHRDVPILLLGALRWLAPGKTHGPFTPTVAPRPAADTEAPASPAFEARAVHGAIPSMVLLVAVLLLLADAVVYHRGRMP